MPKSPTVIGPDGVGVAEGVPVIVDDETEAEPFTAYMLSLPGPPQYSVWLPVQSMLQLFTAGSELA